MKKVNYSFELFKPNLIVFLICLVFFCILLSFVLISMSNNTTYLNYKFISFISKYVDNHLLEIQKYSQELGLHPTNIRLKNETKTIKEYDEQIYTLFDQLKSAKLVNKNIKKIVLFYPSSDLVVSDIGVYPIDSYYRLENFITKYDFKLDLLDHSSFQRIEYEGKPYLSFSNLITTQSGNRSYVITLIDLENILSVLNFDSADFEFSVNFNEETIETLGSLLEKSKNKSLIQYNVSSAFTDSIIYSYKASYTSFFLPLLNLLKICLITIIVMIAFIIYSLIRISKKEANSINNLLEKIGSNENDGKAINIISNRISALLEEKNLSLEEIQSKQTMVNGLFLNLMIADQELTESNALKIASRYGINFDYSSFVIVVIKSVKSPENLRDTIAKQLIEDDYDIFITFRNGCYVILFNIVDESMLESVKIKTRTLLDTVFSSFITFSAIGSIQDSLDKIEQSFNDANNLISNSILKGDNDILVFNEIRNKDPNLAIAEYKLLLSLGKYNTASDKIDEISYSWILPIIKEEFVHFKGKDLFTPLFEKNSSIELAIAELRNILQLFAEAQNNEKTLSIVDKAKKIIDCEFTDPGLGLFQVSSELQVSNSYLSTLFKETEGIGINQYINIKRITMAKELITNTNLTIKDIAISTGFLSDISFIRVFKKYEAITPTSYRRK